MPHYSPTRLRDEPKNLAVPGFSFSWSRLSKVLLPVPLPPTIQVRYGLNEIDVSPRKQKVSDPFLLCTLVVAGKFSLTSRMSSSGSIGGGDGDSDSSSVFKERLPKTFESWFSFNPCKTFPQPVGGGRV